MRPAANCADRWLETDERIKTNAATRRAFIYDTLSAQWFERSTVFDGGMNAQSTYSKKGRPCGRPLGVA
jgi:hypothetical protein